MCLIIRSESGVVCIKIYGKGNKFGVGGNTQFDNIDDLILHYKNHPLVTNKGTIHLKQVYS